MTLTNWLSSNFLDAKIIEEDLLFKIPKVGSFLVIKPKENLLFDESFHLILDDLEMSLAENIDYFTFCFGGKWYYYHKDSDVELQLLKYLGKVKL